MAFLAQKCGSISPAQKCKSDERKKKGGTESVIENVD
jgi:hypothetical protein